MWIIKAGIIPYDDGWYLQQKLKEARHADRIGDTLLLLQHPPVITFGRKAKGNNLVIPEETIRQLGIDCVATDRGGDITYHGPGQMVGYPIIALHERGITIGDYVRKLEAVIMAALRDLGINGNIKRGVVGVWVDDRKIASIGTRVTKGVSTHGFALNVTNDLTPFRYIRPCGIEGTVMTSIAEEARARGDIDYRVVEDLIITAFQCLFNGKDCVVETLSPS